VVSSLLAIAIAVPVSFGVAIFLTELSALAEIPAVVAG
jgi:ABC-type phosphate transport system permease subunit